MAQLINGKEMAAQVREDVRQRVNALKAKGVTPGLAVILVGHDPASEIYVRNKGRACEECGIASKTLILPGETTQEELEDQIRELNRDPAIHGILVQLPLPRGLDVLSALRAISPEKDVDGFHPVHAGELLSNTKTIVPCTPRGIMEMIRSTGVQLRGREAVVVGRSNIVGKPVAMLLLQENCTVTICHSQTEHLPEHTRRADILVAAVGVPGLITADMVKPGAVVIDVGINRVDGRLMGDVDPGAASVAGYITPVPGGVGPMTIAMLLRNTVEAAEHDA